MWGEEDRICDEEPAEGRGREPRLALGTCRGRQGEREERERACGENVTPLLAAEGENVEEEGMRDKAGEAVEEGRWKGGAIVEIRRVAAIFSRPNDRFIMCNSGLICFSVKSGRTVSTRLERIFKDKQ